MPITLGDLATAVAGTLVGDAAALPLSGAATLEAAGPEEITLVDVADKLHLLAKSRAGAAIVPPGTGPLDRPTIEVGDVHAAFAAAIVRFRPPRPRTRSGVSPQAAIEPTARIAADVEHDRVVAALDELLDDPGADAAERAGDEVRVVHAMP